MSAHYDDPSFFYEKYWEKRNYENLSEEIALNHFLKGKKFKSAVDLGGGYGRLTPTIALFSAKTTLIEPSQKQRRIALSRLKENKNISVLPGTAQITGLHDSSTDLVVCIRVMHHIPNPTSALTEISRILTPGGIMILEFANSFHFKARLKSIISGQPILLVPLERRSEANIKKNTIHFVNHHPTTIFKQIQQAGFTITDVLSVSNFRFPLLKKIIPFSILILLEKIMQKLLSSAFFGPSIFVLARKS